MSIKIENLFYTYSIKTPYETKALEDINLKIEQGEYIALVGKTGSGKTTLVQHFNGLIIPQKGEIDIDEFHISSSKKKNKNIHQLRKHVGLVFQFPEYQLFEETIEKDVSFGPKNFKVPEEEALRIAHEKINEVGFDESFYKRSPFELSGGEKRRIAFAGILALNPDILILDEPTAGLDPYASKLILDIIDSLNKMGKTIIVVTHDMNIVSRHAKRVILIKDRKIAFDGTNKEFFLKNADEESIELPLFYKFIKSLRDGGLDLDYTKIENMDSFIEEIKRR